MRSVAGLIVVITVCVIAVVVTLALVRRYLVPPKPASRIVTGPPGPQGPPGVAGSSGPLVTEITQDAGWLTFHLSDGTNRGVKLPTPAPAEPEPDTRHEAQLRRYDPKPGHEAISCHCHRTPLRAGQQVLWWPNEDGTVVLYCDRSEEYAQFVKAAHDLGASQ